MKLKVGLVGLGDQWETRHGPALKALEDRFQVTAICSEVAAKGELVAKEMGAASVDGFRAMIERNDIDAVLALAPDWVGPLPILAACDAGKAVYTSVAFDLAPEHLGAISDRIRNSGVAFMAELPRRFAPATIRLKELIATRLGNPLLVFCHQRHSVEEQNDRLRRGEYCSLTWRNMMEAVDWVCYLAERDPASVFSAQYKHQNMPADEESYYQMKNLEFAADQRPAVMAQMSIGHYIPQRWPDALSYQRPPEVQICCEHGTAFVNLPSNLIWFNEGGQHIESLESDLPVGEQLLINFHRSVTSLVRNVSDMQNAYRAMNVVTASKQSIDENRRIMLSG